MADGDTTIASSVRFVSCTGTLSSLEPDAAPAHKSDQRRHVTHSQTTSFGGPFRGGEKASETRKCTGTDIWTDTAGNCRSRI